MYLTLIIIIKFLYVSKKTKGLNKERILKVTWFTILVNYCPTSDWEFNLLFATVEIANHSRRYLWTSELLLRWCTYVHIPSAKCLKKCSKYGASMPLLCCRDGIDLSLDDYWVNSGKNRRAADHANKRRRAETLERRHDVKCRANNTESPL